MKEQITPEMIEKCQEILKLGTYDCDTFEIEVAPLAPCSIVQGLFPEILDMALEHLKRKASHTLVEWMDNSDNAEERQHVRTLNKHEIPITIFQNRKEQFNDS